ncbi:MAG: DUF4442 domain-containing protein [Chitinophagaceae bacterium]
MNPQAPAFIKLMKHPVKFRMFLFFKLPSAYFSGVRLRDLDASQSRVTVPFKWFSQNPFKSTYFACLAMAAEMSTGLLGLMQLHKRTPAVSMLVVKLEARYHKKATGRTSFVCADGMLFEKTVEQAIATGEAQTLEARSVGRNKEGEIVAEFTITWSFKAKSKK